ncbi:DUF6455 family protein [Thalassococcus sp. BH17M4-6]|uniref:DUF6455 family protein n=1 Tax=Thalassococcus sp. BH17M4-6 TaxID=3413148 RepID=UPI003BD18F38
MQSQSTLKRHAILVDRMASHMDIDLEEAALRGRITISEIDDAVLRCTACTRPCACAALLDSDALPAGTVPQFCRNGDLFKELSK